MQKIIEDAAVRTEAQTLFDEINTRIRRQYDVVYEASTQLEMLIGRMYGEINTNATAQKDKPDTKGSVDRVFSTFEDFEILLSRLRHVVSRLDGIA